MNVSYIIPIGGTGIRVMKSILNLCMAGCVNNDEKLKVMCVDSDDINGNAKELGSILDCYRKVGNNLFPEIELNKVNGTECCVWSPLSGDEFKDKHSSMSEMVSQGAMGADAQNVFKVLYTDAEREKKLEGGFYGHTSIGSYFMAQEVVKDDKITKVWNDFFDGNGDNKENANVFIIGSIFGGTGASGVPTIAKLIRTQYPKMNIGGLFVMPYFNPKRETETDISKNLEIDGNSFTAKTKTALSFYRKQGYDKVFNTMYFIGEPSNMLNVSYHDSGEKQKNKATPMELFSATAFLNFIKSDQEEKNSEESGAVKFYAVDFDEENNIPKLVLSDDLFNKLFNFLRFSMLYTKYIYPCIEQNYPKKVVKSYRTNENMQNHKALNKCCKNYIKWIKELILENNSNGTLDTNKENNMVKWFNYKGYENLYDGKELAYDVLPKRLDGIFSEKKYKKCFRIDEKKDRSEVEKLEKLSSLAKGKESAYGYQVIREFWKPNGSKGGNPIKRLYTDVCSALEKYDKVANGGGK